MEQVSVYLIDAITLHSMLLDMAIAIQDSDDSDDQIASNITVHYLDNGEIKEL